MALSFRSVGGKGKPLPEELEAGYRWLSSFSRLHQCFRGYRRCLKKGPSRLTGLHCGTLWKRSSPSKLCQPWHFYAKHWRIPPHHSTAPSNCLSLPGSWVSSSSRHLPTSPADNVRPCGLTPGNHVVYTLRPNAIEFPFSLLDQIHSNSASEQRSQSTKGT